MKIAQSVDSILQLTFKISPLANIHMNYLDLFKKNGVEANIF